MTDVTRILSAIEQGDPSAAEAMRRILVDRARRCHQDRLQALKSNYFARSNLRYYLPGILGRPGHRPFGPCNLPVSPASWAFLVLPLLWGR
jgi:hypothetical protein